MKAQRNDTICFPRTLVENAIFKIEKYESQIIRQDSIIYLKDLIIASHRKQIALYDSTLTIRTIDLNKIGFDLQISQDKIKNKNKTIVLLFAVIILDSFVIYLVK